MEAGVSVPSCLSSFKLDIASSSTSPPKTLAAAVLLRFSVVAPPRRGRRRKEVCKRFTRASVIQLQDKVLNCMLKIDHMQHCGGKSSRIYDTVDLEGTCSEERYSLLRGSVTGVLTAETAETEQEARTAKAAADTKPERNMPSSLRQCFMQKSMQQTPGGCN